MNKSIILSVSQEEALNILNGKQTALLRKRIPKHYKGWVYGHVGKGKPYLINKDILSEFYELREKYLITYFDEDLNGTIPFRFWFDEYDTIKQAKNVYGNYLQDLIIYQRNEYYLLSLEEENYFQKLQISKQDVLDKIISNKKDLYALSIKQLETFDKPMQLSDFISTDYVVFDTDVSGKEVDFYKQYIPLKTAPKNYQYVWVKEGE